MALTARSRFTGEDWEREPRLVRRRVSGDTPTMKWVGVKEVMVRQVPGLRDVLAAEPISDEGGRLGRKEGRTWK